MRRSSRFIAVLLFATTLSANAVFRLQAEETGTTVSPVEKAERVRWDAVVDLKAMSGRWALVGTPIPGGFDEVPVINALVAKGSELQVHANAFRIDGTDWAGSVSNDMNQIEFRPEKFWLNTEEPKMRFAMANGVEVSVSYVVEEETLRFRYPANSCSRSGIIMTFKRVTD